MGKSLEVEFEEGDRCNKTGIEISITTSFNKRNRQMNRSTKNVRICKFDVKFDEKEKKYLVNPIGNDRSNGLKKCFNDKKPRMLINNLNLPLFKMRSKKNHDFCLKSVTLTTKNGVAYMRNFTSHTKKQKDTRRWMPMFESTLLDHQRRQLESLKCPEDDDVQLPSCPKG